MKKIKLILSLSSLGMLVATATIITTSCSSSIDKDNGTLEFNTKEELSTWLKSSDFIVSNKINITSGKMSSIANFLNDYVTAIHITRGIASVLSSTLPIELGMTKFKYTTTKDISMEVIASLYTKDDNENCIEVIHTFKKINNCLFDSMTGKRNGVILHEDFILTSNVAIVDNSIELNYEKEDEEPVITHIILTSDFPNVTIN